MPTTRADNFPSDAASKPSPRAFTVAELAERVDGELHGDGTATINGINDLTNATPDQITFITSRRYARQWRESRAGAAIANADVVDAVLAQAHGRADRPVIAVADAELASITVLSLFEPPHPVPEVGVHPTACVHESVKVGRGVRIGPHVSIDHDAVIGDGVVLHAGARVYAAVHIGDATVVHSNAVVRERCVIGRHCIVHPGVVIGADGFGYRPAPDGSGLLKVPQIGYVEIHDAVEIGANTTIDRGKFGPTVVGAGTKIDNLCQIAHNCRIGRACVIAAAAAIGGSVKIGDGVVIGGAVAIREQRTIGDAAQLGGRTAVTRDVPPGERHGGFPNDRGENILRQWAAIRRLPKVLKQFKPLDDTPLDT